MNCPYCQAANPEHAKFCNNCGKALAAAPAPEKPAFNLDQYMPPELAAKLETARGQNDKAGERRVITMLFCDVKGSTAAAEQLDPEEWTEIMNGAFEHMIRPIYKYEGTVVRLMGDAILAFFGAPITHEDDPQRAVLAALDIRSRMQPFSEDIQSRHAVGFNIRVGINTGLVVVGEIGSDLRMEYTALGDAVNLAARMEQTALPGTIQISHETYKLIAPFFEIEPLGEIEVKGKSAPVKTYRVLSAKETGGQLRGLEGLSSPLVGREQELALLDQRLQMLDQGRGGFVAVMGEAGLGKSTLVAAARKESEAAGHLHWLAGSALSYAHSVSYFAWRQVIRQSIGAQESDSPAQVRAKMSEQCECCALPGGDRPFLEAILAVESEQSLQTVMGYQGEALIQRMSEATRGYLCGLASEAPLVLVLDDLHWADDASLNLLLHLVELIEANPVLFICTLRPDESTTSREAIKQINEKLGDKFQPIALAPLPQDQIDILAENLLGMPELPAHLHNLIMEKAEGNPFFVEEVIRSLIETKNLVRENDRWRAVGEAVNIVLPNTLAGVLSARIDRLPEPARQVLQTAAVIGRTFDRRVVQALDQPAADLDQHLQELQQAGLIQLIEINREAHFIFRHALIQDAAYNSILIKRRQSLHRRIGEVLEQLFPERLEELAPLLAHHFYTAKDPRALNYGIQAGDIAARLYANAEAIIHYSHALEIAKQVDASTEQIGRLYAKRGGALELASRYEQALANYDEMEAFAREHKHRALELAALTGRAAIYSTFTSAHNPALAEKTMLQALGVAWKMKDKAAQAKLHWNLMLAYLFSKRLEAAREHGEVALHMARGLDNREQLAFVLNDLGRVYTCVGEFEQAYAVLTEARALWRELDNQAMLADSLGAEAEARSAAGEYDKVLELCHAALRISEKIENMWGQCYNRILLSFVHFDRGEADLAVQMAREGIELGEQVGMIATTIGVRTDLAWMYGCYGAPEAGLTLIGQALTVVAAQQPAWEALPKAAMLRLHLLQGDLPAAEAVAAATPLEPVSIPYAHYTILILQAHVELALAKHAYSEALRLADDLLAQVSALTRPGVLEVLYCKSEALIGLGQPAEAHAVLTQARAAAEAIGVKQLLWQILARLAMLESDLGHETEAGNLRSEARQIVLSIADRLEAVGMKAAFLNKADVQALIG